MIIYRQFRVIWSKSHVDKASSFHVINEQNIKKSLYMFRYIV